jgi:hypothetical protein
MWRRHLQNVHIRAMGTVVTLALLISAGSGTWSTALAQEQLPSSALESLRMKAPIGHRQPRVQDLPPDVAKEEGVPTPGQRAFDEQLRICRDC